jgi:formyl-CoA transferase
MFETADYPLMLAVGNDEAFVRFCGAVGRREWGTAGEFSRNRDRIKNRNKLVALVQAELVKNSRDYWLKTFTGLGIPCAPVNSVPDVVDEEQTDAMKLIQRVGEKSSLVGLPISFNKTRPKIRRRAPMLFEQNDLYVKHTELEAGLDEGIANSPRIDP